MRVKDDCVLLYSLTRLCVIVLFPCFVSCELCLSLLLAPHIVSINGRSQYIANVTRLELQLIESATIVSA